MTNAELVLNMLAELSATEISKEKQPGTFEANRRVAGEGGTVAKVARDQLEKATGRKVISSENAATIRRLNLLTVIKHCNPTHM